MKITVDLEREELITLFNAIDFEKTYCIDNIHFLKEEISDYNNILNNNPLHPDGEEIYYSIANNEQEIESLNKHLSFLTTISNKLNKSLRK